MEFKILKKSQRSNARLGIIKTDHGIIKTPAFIGVATQATIKTLDSKEVIKTKTQALICNTFHLHLRPQEHIIAKNGGLHKFMDWHKPLMTDSGGYQVFSLGFGKDYGTGKIINKEQSAVIKPDQQPKNIKITEDGVWFRSPIDGRELFIGPKESIEIQKKLGADIIFAFDECPSPLANYEYNKKALKRTHRWAIASIEANDKKSPSQKRQAKQAIYGIIQGGKYKDLRIESAKFISLLPFDGFGIGGEFGSDKKTMEKMIGWVIKEIPEQKPRHLLGIGKLEDIPIIIKQGIDTFDCTIPTHYARHGYAFISKKSNSNQWKNYQKIDLNKTIYLKDLRPLDKNCDCYVCKSYTRSYLHHLLKAKEITALKLLTFHNLYYFNRVVEKIRDEIKKGKF